MIGNIENNEPIEAGPEPLPSGNQPDTNNRASFEDLSQAHAVLSDIKNDIQAKEVIIDIEKATENDDIVANDDRKIENLDYFIYGHYGQYIQPPKTTLVMFHSFKGGVTLPANKPRLAYSPTRNDFVQFTLSIVLAMLVITASVVTAVRISDDLKEIFQTFGVFLAPPATGLMTILTYMITCSACTRRFPCNYIVLFLAVTCMSIICAWITSRYETEIVLMALVATCIVVFVCILLAFSGFDFTAWMLYVVIIGITLTSLGSMVLVMMLITGTYMPSVRLIMLCVGTLMNAIMLTMNLQMVLGGGAIEIGENDFALGAFLIYTSIIDLFLKLVQILGIVDKS